MKMRKIEKPTDAQLKNLKVKSWGTWSKEKSKFDWSYDEQETCYILEGEVEVTDTETGEKLSFKAGDLVQFDVGLKCMWNVKKPVKKHYNFGDLKLK